MNEGLTKACLNFAKEFDIQNKKISYGIGALEDDKETGIILYFESKLDMIIFPFKEESYHGIPVYKKVIGKIRFA